MSGSIQRWLLAVVLVAAAPVWASGTKGDSGYQEIERGFFVGLSGGPSWVLKPPASTGPRPTSFGQAVELRLGMDLGAHLSLSLFVEGALQGEGANYLGDSEGTASGDFSLLVPGISAQFNLLGISDAQGVSRSWFYVRGGVGYARFGPKSLLPNSDVLVFAGPGIQYFTRLRHFSIGLELSVTYLLHSSALGFQLEPTLRYAF